MGTKGKGTGSAGLHNKKTHQLCRRCGKNTMHIQKKKCAGCGYPNAKVRKFNWSVKAQRRRTTGTGRLRHLGKLPRLAKNGFRFGTTAAPKVKA